MGTWKKFFPIHANRPAQTLPGTQMQNRRGGHPIVCKVPIARQNRVGLVVIRRYADEIAEFAVIKRPKIGRGQARVGRARQQLGRHQLIGERLKKAKAEVKLTLDKVGGLDKLKGAAGIGRNRHRELAVMVMGECLESQPRLAQIAQASRAIGPSPALVQRGQQQPRQHGDHRYHAEQFD